MQRYTVYLYLETALHVSGGTFTHHQEHIQLYLRHLLLFTATWRYSLYMPDHDQQRSNRHAPTVKPEAPSAVVRSWWWAEMRPKHVEPHINVKYLTCETVASCWLIYLNCLYTCSLFLYDTLMKIAEAIATCRRIVIYNFIYVHLLFCYIR